MHMTPLAEEVLFHNEDNQVFVLDTPTSIAVAQKGGLGNDALISYKPVDVPYASTEPKSQAATHLVTNHGVDNAVHSGYVVVIRAALQELTDTFEAGQAFCRERALPKASTAVKANVKRSPSPTPLLGERRAVQQRDLTSKLTSSNEMDANSLTCRLLSCPSYKQAELLTVSQDDMEDFNHNVELINDSVFFHNDLCRQLTLLVNDDSVDPAPSFRIPTSSAFLLGQCKDINAFRTSSRAFLSSADKRHFDFILLDPPWPNRSAKRRGSYEIQPDLRSTKNMLHAMDLDTQIRPGGFSAVWITNRPSVRDLVLGPGGLFEAWNVALCEEWVYVKVTTSGEPVYPLEGKWRKPYEVLLVGKRPADPMALAQQDSPVMTRVIAAVPDLHSRKPCLKTLVGRILLPDVPDYTGLEIFARHLVAGWFSWGNEVLKYNSSCAWASLKDPENETGEKAMSIKGSL